MKPSKNFHSLATFPASLPFFLPAEGGRAVLLIHGYTGIPEDFRFLAGKLNEAGFAVSVPRLPGHGTSGADLLEARARDWLRRIADEYFDLRARYASVDLCGLSMGALLAILVAAKYGTERLILAAPAIKARDPRLVLSPFFRFFVKTLPRPEYVFKGPEEYVYLAREYWEKTWVGPAAELRRLQVLAKKNLPEVRAKTLVIVSEKDDTVPLEAADLIERKIAARSLRRLTLEESGHVVVNGSEKEKVAEEIISWLREDS